MALVKDVWRHRWTRMAGEIVFWRAASTAISFVGWAWAMRCLGPVNLGISGMVQNVAANLVFIICLQVNGAFVRLAKESKDQVYVEHISHCLTSFRFFVSTILCSLVGAGIFIFDPPAAWRLASLAALPYVIFSAIDVSWLLQAKEKMPLQQRITTLRNFLTAAASFAFFRPGMDPGWDLVLAAAVTAVSVLVGWRAAFGRLRGVITWRNALDCLPYLRQSSRQAISATASWVYYGVQMPLIGWLGSVREVGLVRTANQLVTPFERTARTMNAMIFPRFVHWRKEAPEKMWRVQFAIVGLMLGAALVSGIVGTLVFPWVLPWMLGPEFKEAALPCALLLAVKCVMVADENLILSFWAQHRDGEVTRLLFALTIVVSVLLYLLVPRFGAMGAAWSMLIVEVVATGWLGYRRWVTSRQDAAELAAAPIPAREAGGVS